MRSDGLTIYTDGSCYHKPSRRGGAGFLFVSSTPSGDEQIEEFELRGYKGSSGNQMELFACVAALKEVLRGNWLSRFRKVEIRTDSMYIVDSHRLAIYEWSRNKWRNRKGRPVEHAELWRDLLRLLVKCHGRVSFKWVRGHAKDQHNKAADKLAKRSAKGVLNKPLNVVSLRKKRSPLRLQRGAVRMRGQTETVRIVMAKMLKQKEQRYIYEVTAAASPDYPKVDVAYSMHDLRAGHEYEVVFNGDQDYPQIESVVQEVTQAGAGNLEPVEKQ